MNQRQVRTVGWSNALQVGLVWDSRDRETGPRRGIWSELLIRRVDEALGSATGYTQGTFTDRRYFSLAPGLTFANRFMIQQVFGDAPFYDLYVIESSYKRQEGLGGAETVRGLLKNRYFGKGLFLWNAELRWRVLDVDLLRRNFYLVVSGFVDSGRVWEERIELLDVSTNLHRGVGGGLRLGMGDNFVLSLDIGYGSEAGLRIYTGTGYLF
jgi:outer membrane protein assembly factor BamA